MQTTERVCLVCSCGDTIALDRDSIEQSNGAKRVRFARSLCRDETELVRDAVAAGGDVTIACTQEAPLFGEVREDALGDMAPEAPELRFANIRERAGWTTLAANRADKANLAAKIAALLTEAALVPTPSPSVTLRSDGDLWILGRDETALQAAFKLAERLDVTVLLDSGAEVLPPRRTDFPVFAGSVVRASGHLGTFQLEISGMQPASPSSRDKIVFDGTPKDGAASTDLVLDLRGGTPLFPAPEKRDGYFNPDPGSPVAIAEAVGALADMVGEFEKPRYVDYARNICAHARSRIVGCSRCIDTCPTGAVVEDGDGVRFDPQICAGCGTCASACPSGAAHYGLPDGNDDLKRLRALLRGYLAASGKHPVLLIHDESFGEEAIDMIARLGPGLPPHVLPFATAHVTQVGLHTLLAAAAYGAAHCVVLLAPNDIAGRAVLEEQISFARAVLSGLGYGEVAITVLDEADPDRIAAALIEAATPPALAPAAFEPVGRKRTIIRLALDHLHENAPTPVAEIALPAGAPFGAVAVDRGKCTLCMSCVGACPAGALRDDKERPHLAFVEDACVQCGLCTRTCPEKALSLTPRLSFAAEVRDRRVLNEEEPFHCIACGKPFATKSSLDRLTAKLTGHPMFADERALDRLKMCETCRVVDMAENAPTPMAMGTVPKTRTTQDYIAERDAATGDDGGELS